MYSSEAGAVRLCNSKKEQEVLDNYSGVEHVLGIDSVPT